MDIVDVDIRAWVESARTNPVLYRDRQVTEILLAAIGLSPTLSDTLVLKGGAVMALAFKSDRVTGDVDFTSMAEPEDMDVIIVDELNASLPKAAVRLGYLDLVCRVQSIKKMPRPSNFIDADFPALLVRVGSAVRNTSEEARLKNGQASRVLDVEISFRDQVYAFQELHLSNAGAAVKAFTVNEIISEKLRALLQQPIRNRNRRQDVYDISFLVEESNLDQHDRSEILATLKEKCATRGIDPNIDSINDEEVIERARKDWNTLELEIGSLPSFDDRFAIVSDLYKSLPW